MYNLNISILLRVDIVCIFCYIIVQKAKESAKNNPALDTTISAPGMVTRSSMHSARGNATRAASSTTDPTTEGSLKMKRLTFVEDEQFSTQYIPHHSQLREDYADFDRSCYTTAADDAANTELQSAELWEARQRGLFSGEYYEHIPETADEAMILQIVVDIVEAALDVVHPPDLLLHDIFADTRALSNTELLQYMRESVATITSTMGISVRQAYTVIFSRSAFLQSNEYSPDNLRMFINGSAGNFKEQITRTRMEHAREAAVQILAEIAQGSICLFIISTYTSYFLFLQ